MKLWQWIATRSGFASPSMLGATRFAMLRFALVLGLSLLAWESVGRAQTIVALVDMAQVFDNHPTFKQQLQALKLDADTLQNSVIAQRDQIQAEAESAGLINNVGSPAFKEKEKELAMKLAQIDVNSKTAMRDLMAREARLHYDVYREVNQMVESYCVANNVRLVLRYNRPAIDEKNPETIMQLINSMVVYHQPNQDITPIIIETLRNSAARQGRLPTGANQ